MLSKNERLIFIQNKIKDISFARFMADPNSTLYPPNNIIATLKTDNEGNIWFLTSHKKFSSEIIDEQFPACLDYYQKGSDYRLSIKGDASIEEKVPEVDSFQTDAIFNNVVLVKFKINYAEYFENRLFKSDSAIEKMVNYINRLFIFPSHRKFDFSGNA